MDLLEEGVSVAISDVCVRDIEASMTHTVPLSVREAWSIAMCWKRQLERRAIVSIRLATDDALDGMQSYEWVEIEGTPGRDERALGAAVHAICTTWTLLSRCRGYRGEENPVFWKYVVDRWCNRDVNDQVSNTVRFFTRHAFPRFRLNQITHFRGERSAMEFCRAVFGQDPDVLRVSWIQSTLNDIRSRLLPHIESTRQYDPVPISLGLATHRLVSCIPDLLTPNTGDVDFVPYEICLQGHFSVNASAIAALKTLLLSHHLDIPLLTLPESFRDDDEALVDFVRVVFGLESQVKARVRSIAIDKYQVSDQDVAALCSALPHGCYLRSFSFSRSQSPPPMRRGSIARSFVHSAQPSDSSRHDWAWLGYALFHPATESSSWRELQLQNVRITAEAVHILMSMARGNNLLAVLKGRLADCTSYTKARLACGAKIMSTTHAFASHLVTLNEVQDVDVPGVSSTDLKALGKFVPVIIRGYGLAYTSRRNVVSLTPQPASPTAWLTGLKIDAQNHDDPIARFLADLLTMLGTKLEHLDIRRFGAVEPQLLRKLLLLTPQLRSLALDHSGELWSHEGHEVDWRGLPRLRELELLLTRNKPLQEPTSIALRTCFCDLTALRITIVSHNRGDERILLEQSREAILTILRGLPTLQCFHWEKHCAIARWPRMAVPYRGSRQPEQITMMELLGFNEDDRKMQSVKLSDVKGKYAFLSVVRVSTSALSRLHRDVSARILEYATTRDARDISIEW